MSTEINGFYIRETDDIYSHNDFMCRFKIHIDKYIKEFFFKYLITDFLLSKRNNKDFLKVVFENRANFKDEEEFKYIMDNLSVSNHINYISTYAMLANNIMDKNINSKINFKFEIYFYMLNGKTFYTFYNYFDQNVVDFSKNILQRFPELKAYDYWDNSSKPNNITNKEWNTRKEEYKALFKGSNKYIDALYAKTVSVDCLTFSFKYLKNMIQYFPEQKEIDEFLLEKTKDRNLLLEEILPKR